MYLLPVDELNTLDGGVPPESGGKMNPFPFEEYADFVKRIAKHFDKEGRVSSEQDKEDIIDEMFDLFLVAYASGQEVTNETLKSKIKADTKTVTDTVEREVAGKTWRERVDEHFKNGGKIDDILRVAVTEAHRDANEAAYKTAKGAKATKKTWNCLMLPTSRDSHIYLDGVTIPLDAEFISPNGGSTLYPCEWGIAEEDVNCLCWLTYSK